MFEERGRREMVREEVKECTVQIQQDARQPSGSLGSMVVNLNGDQQPGCVYFFTTFSCPSAGKEEPKIR